MEKSVIILEEHGAYIIGICPYLPNKLHGTEDCELYYTGEWCGSVLKRMYKHLYKSCLLLTGGPGSSVGIATDYGLDGPGIESWWGEIFHLSRPALGPTQLPVQWVPGVKYGRGVLLTTHPLLVPWSWKSRAIPLLPLQATTGPVTGTLYLYF